LELEPQKFREDPGPDSGRALTLGGAHVAQSDDVRVHGVQLSSDLSLDKYVNVVSVKCFDLPRQQWSLLNRFRTEQGHCGVCRRKWRLTDTDLCPCGETQAMSHIVESCPLTKLNGGLSRLHSADEDAVSWLTNYGK